MSVKPWTVLFPIYYIRNNVIEQENSQISFVNDHVSDVQKVPGRLPTKTVFVRSTGAEMTQLSNQRKFTCVIVVIQNGFLLESLQLQHHGLDLRGTHSWQKTGQITQQSWGQCSLNTCGCNDHKVKVTPGQQVEDWLWSLKNSSSSLRFPVSYRGRRNVLKVISHSIIVLLWKTIITLRDISSIWWKS